MKIIFLAVAAFVITSSLPAQYRHDSHRGGRGRTSVSIVASLPFGAVALNWGNHPYHYYQGVYYNPVASGYQIIQPPMGIIVPALPPGSVSVVIGPRNYFRFGTVFYLPLENNNYQVVPAPAASDSATGSASAGNYDKMEIEGKTYYKKGGKIYKASVTGNGEVAYEEVGKTMKE